MAACWMTGTGLSLLGCGSDNSNGTLNGDQSSDTATTTGNANATNPDTTSTAGGSGNTANVTGMGGAASTPTSMQGGNTASGNTTTGGASTSVGGAATNDGVPTGQGGDTTGGVSNSDNLGGTTAQDGLGSGGTLAAGGVSNQAGASAAAGTTGNAGASSGGMSSGGAGNAGGEHAEDVAFCLAELDSAAQHYEGFLSTYTDPSQIPRSVAGSTARIVAASDWTSGFPAGSLWYLYEHTGEQSWRSAAEAWTDALYGQRNRTSDHDVGFIIGSSYGNGLRLTGNTDYEQVLTTAAASLSSRFNATVGAIRSWDFGSWQYPVIIDNMMNLELLWRATELSGDDSYANVAVSHANKTLANHFRSDASSYHVLDYNTTTGAVISKQTNQGLNDESAWARGQAWGLYGYTMSYRESQDSAYLDHAMAIADFYTQSDRMPEDKVPYFDFDAPILNDVPDHRDVSAGAIAASALLELARYAPAEASARYLDFSLGALRSMASSSYRAALGTNGHFLLMHAVGNYPIDDEIDVAINYADYYYLEALVRCSQLE